MVESAKIDCISCSRLGGFWEKVYDTKATKKLGGKLLETAHLLQPSPQIETMLLTILCFLFIVLVTEKFYDYD